ncbi:MAG: hypothetical protein ACLQPD_16350 [Desulfomonilaceae bacterium]
MIGLKAERCFNTFQNIDSDSLRAGTRIAFWIFGPLAAAILTYTTRYFINGDAMTYIEMGEALINGRFSALANLTYSPGYPVLLGLAQSILKTNPLNEIQSLKIVNFFCFLLAMSACDRLMTLARKELERFETTEQPPVPIWIFNALCYSMFLVASLALVRLGLLNPDMLIFALVLLVAAVILRIRESPDAYSRYAALGLATGIGYLSKSFFLVFSPIFFLSAAACSASVRRALPRLLVAVLVTLIVSAPLIGALSDRLGRFTYGELGKHVYAFWIFGQGDPIYPKVINEKPKTVLYRYDIQCTRPSGFDICYWYEGFRPVFNLNVHAPIIARNVVSVFLQAPWLLLIAIWYIFQWRLGDIRIGPLRPTSIFIVLFTISIAGIAFYCLLNVEPRYIASFLFLGFVALVMSVRYPEHKPRSRVLMLGSAIALTLFFMGLSAYSLVDQSCRSLRSKGGKLSYKEAFLEQIAVKDFLQKQGIVQGDEIAIIGSPPVNWARMAGVKIVAEVPDIDQMLSASAEQRAASLAALRNEGVKSIVVKDVRFREPSQSNWIPIPGTGDYFAHTLQRR